ncbi:PAS domain-containing protein [Polyangium aurulentum]|uniref:PAS domain-containing protein n=1 Tax=Polyangium aurulentum TaxID=2567896 RepID=UPI0010AEDE43|nr:PAS domain-containing protein [Polyangium aurulentum]UQA62084.1 PAS domain-containing protein [Polyangium aurulentum]
MENETERLRARVAELERAAEDLRRRESEALREKEILRRVIDALPQAVFWKDCNLVYIGGSQRFAEHAGLPSAEVVRGKTDDDCCWPPAQTEKYRNDDREVLESGKAKLHIIEPETQANGQTVWVETSKVPLRDDEGRLIGLVGIYEDITGRMGEEAALASEREALIMAQAALLSELSTPLLPIHEKVLVMPLIGRIDEGRSRIVMERLLDGVVGHQAETVILDLTGVPVVDAAVATGVLSAARAAELLGTRVILTGIRPELARTIIETGLDLGGVQTFGTLRDGVAYATRGRRGG